jgi:DNA polymerase-1
VIVTKAGFSQLLAHLGIFPSLAVDTETYGLRPHDGDRLFSIIISTGKLTCYFNFQRYDGVEPLGYEELEALKNSLFNQEREWIMHNAKFDLSILSQEGIEVKGKIWDTMVMDRVISSLLEIHDFSLEKTAKRHGLEKSQAVDSWLKKHQAFTEVEIPGKGRTEKRLHFDQVTFDIIAPYGITDGEITYKIAESQRVKLAKMDSEISPKQPSVQSIVRMEQRLLRVVYDMETRGVLVDQDFCRRAVKHEEARGEEAAKRFAEMTGERFLNSGKVFAHVFESDRERWSFGAPTKVKGEINPTFDSDTLQSFTNPAAKEVITYRDAKSKSDFYHGFLWHTSQDGYLRANFNQHGARTGRFTSSKPNLQNMTKDEGEELKEEFVVRRAIIPAPGHFLGMIDFDQMEYKLLLDYCNPAALIEKVVGGMDVHQATAEIAGITRTSAKTVNFATLYGSGDQALATGLKTTLEHARAIKASVLDASPEIKEFIRQVKYNAVERRYLYTWLGRVLRFPYRDLAYKSVNSLIQGGCADIVKCAMIAVDDFLKGYETKLVLTIHDELVFHGPLHEIPILPMLRYIMTKSYPHKHIELTAGIDVSAISLADKIPYEEFVNGSL